jgi:glycosyltransferase involved in cell wall biosynthesis
MRLHLTGAFEYMDVNVGFGNAAHHIYQEFKRQGIKMSVSKPDDRRPFRADVEMCFDQPQRYKFVCDGAYRIGYTPWESTGIPREWNIPMSACDEIWTPNNFGQQVFTNLFPDKPVFVFQHGVSQSYRPRRRRLQDDRPFRFLFMGEPQWRKDGQMATNVFLELFADNPEYELIIKATKICNIDVKDKSGRLHGTPDSLYSNVTVMRKIISPAELIQLYSEIDVFIYPTWGEGWGFNPMQAMAMGIPTISTHVWADYAKYITVPIDSYPFQSPWPEIHPGMMFKPDRNQLAFAMKNAKDNYDQLSALAFKNSFALHENYNWEKVCSPAVERIQKIFSSLDLKV